MSAFLDTLRASGVAIEQTSRATVWSGPYAGAAKPTGPLRGRRIGVLVASDFSDWQAYYLLSYVGELGGQCEFLLVDWVGWRFTKPTVASKGVVGRWGLSVSPNPTIPEGVRYTFRSAKGVRAEDYAALIVLGGFSADVMVPETEVTNLLRKALEAGAVVSSIGAGAIPLLAAGLLRGRRCTGNAVVAFMMREACRFEDAPVVVDGKLMTARDTIDTPRLLHQLARHFDPEYQDIRAGILAGCRALFVTGDEFEDIELTVPVMELLHRGCEIAIATFAPRIRAASALGSGLAAIGSFGVTVPFQEIDRSSYRLLDTRDVRMEDFDLLIVPGGFNPWNMIEAVEPVDILRRAQAHGKVIGLICHSEIVGAAAGVLSGKVTCGWLACKSSVEIMGGDYSFERSAAIDGNIVSGRTPNDVPEFLDACTEALLCRRRGSTWSPPTQLG